MKCVAILNETLMTIIFLQEVGINEQYPSLTILKSSNFCKRKQTFQSKV